MRTIPRGNQGKAGSFPRCQVGRKSRGNPWDESSKHEENPKSQIPNPKKIPNGKFQDNRALLGIWDLGFGILDFEIWCLVLGIFPAKLPFMNALLLSGGRVIDPANRFGGVFQWIAGRRRAAADRVG